MELVLDANILVAGFLRSALTRELLLDERLSLVMPEFTLVESEKVLSSSRLRKRLGGLTPQGIRGLLHGLTARVKLYSQTSYQSWLPQAKRLAPHPEDAPYLALALSLGIPLWSNDLALKNQSRVPVHTTQELLEILRTR